MTENPELALVLDRLAEQIAGIAESTDDRLVQLTAEVKELRDTRMRPYITSMALFVAIVTGVMSYVYNLEMRSVRAFFEMQDRLQVVELRGELNNTMLRELDERMDRTQDRLGSTLDRIRKRTSELEPLEGE